MSRRSEGQPSREQGLRRDRGSAGLEAVALVPLIILVGTMLLQLGVAAWTTVAADTAARSAARAMTLGRDARAAADSSLPGTLIVDPATFAATHNSDSVKVNLSVKIPRVSLLPQFTVSRDAVMPDIRR